jgi:hypothetical protein
MDEEVVNINYEEPEKKDDYEQVSYQLELFDKYVEKLWNKIVEKYISENNSLLLEKVSKEDKSKFYKFMYENSPIYKSLVEALKKLDYE